MHPSISTLPNALVYSHQLIDDPTAAAESLDPWYNRDWGFDTPVLRIDTQRADAWCSTVVAGGRTSRMNFLSATIAVNLALQLLLRDRDPPENGDARIIIATPFRPQAQLISVLLRQEGIEGEVIAGTVHSFQGSEAPVVIYDLVVDDPHRRAGVFWDGADDSNRRQFNVGLTRARDRLFVIGDYKFMEANSKKAFLGKLLAELAKSPRVEAEDVVPVSLAARTASAQFTAGGDEPTAPGNHLVVTQREFDEYFLPDLAKAAKRLVIYSPFITTNRLEIVGPHLRAAVERGVAVYVVTKTFDERNKADAPAYRTITSALLRWGVHVVPKKAMHEKLVFVDDDVLWIGSLNPLSFRATREIMERRNSREIADKYRRTLQLDIAFDAFEGTTASCPICGSELALAEGPRGTYLRCVVPHCYARSLTDPPLRDGKMACHSCGGELYYGVWGQTPHWRCHNNSKHRIEVHPNHLKLPAMAAMLTKAELDKLHRRFASERQKAKSNSS